MIIVFIAGASCSGKSRFTENLLEKLRELQCNSLSIKMDDYYKEIPDDRELVEYKRTTNFDDPNSLDLSLLSEHVFTLGGGGSIIKPVFDFKTEKRIGTESIAAPAILLIDGTSAISFCTKFPAGTQTSYKVFIEAEQEVIIQRKIERDKDERGYDNTESILQKDAKFVRPTYIALIEPTKLLADIIIDNNTNHDASNKSQPLVVEAERIARELKERLEPIPNKNGRRP
ncbi:MAG: uridine kinase [Gammaproteobacteria bacterium]